MPNSRPRVRFNEEGICNACLNAEEKLKIKTIYIDGPLKDLKTDWQFNPISRSKTVVNFSVHFEFKRFFHQKFIEIFYPLIENKMIESFKQRANQILN